MRQAEEISRDIWEMARQEISCACPFFAPLLDKIEILVRKEQKGYGLDRFRIWYEPLWILKVYKQSGRKKLNRMLLHSFFHLLYLHLAEQKMEEEYWNLACDMVAEYTIDCLKKPYLTGEVDEKKRNIYQKFWKEGEGKTAYEIYEKLREYSKEEIKNWIEIFCMDSHELWRKLTKEEIDGIKSEWEKMIAKVGSEGGISKNKAGTQKGNTKEWYELQKKKRRDYQKFLQRFSIKREEVQADLDSFDYIPYYYGLCMYQNMPFIEPLEYTETTKLEELVIAIDTSNSCSREMVQFFLEETASMLGNRENFFKKFKVYLIQCDCFIQDVTFITSMEEWKTYSRKIKIQGRGGTDFRPVFAYIEQLKQEQKLKHLKGLIYFSDGDGIFPSSKPDYETAFVFLGEPKESITIPNWVLSLSLNRTK